MSTAATCGKTAARTILVVLFSVYFLLGTFEARAQTTIVYGSIVGTVTDQGGGVVVGALVRATNVSTGITTSAQTDAQGFYRIEPLLPATYRVDLAHPGFKSLVRRALVLSAGQTVRADISLEVGQVTESVEVTAPTPLIETDSPQVSSTMAWAERKYLPTGNSDFFSAVALVPGAATATPSFTVSFVGSRSTQYDYSLDGATFRNPTGGHNPFVAAFIENQQEVKTSYVNNSAEYASMAAVNITTKSGTNEYHGTAVWNYTSGGFQAKDPFSPEFPSMVWHRFSTSVGGPLVRNRAFFFAAYSGERQYDRLLNVATVPTGLMRQGIFSEISTQIMDPLTGQPFPNRTIPDSRISSVARNFIEMFYPLPNFGGPGFQAGNYRTLVSEAASIMDDLNFRVDHRINERQSVFARYSYDKGNRGGFFTGSIATVGLRRGYRQDQSAVLSHAYVLRPNIYNEASLGWSRDTNVILGSTFGPDVAKKIGLQGITVLAVPAIPTMTIAGFTAVRQQSFQEAPNEIFSFRDNVSWIAGRHRMKAGLLFMNKRSTSFPFNVDDFYGRFSFTNTFATRNAMADFLLGLPQTIFRNNGQFFDRVYWRRNTWQIFFQDDVQLGRNLTLNAGLRYEWHQPFFDKNGRSYAFDLATGSIVASNESALQRVNPQVRRGFEGKIVTGAGFPSRLIRTDVNNFAPRVGLAYRPVGGWVIRAGYGIYYDFTAVLQGNLAPFIPGEDYLPNRIVDGVPLYQFPNPFANASALPVGTLALDVTSPNLIMPYSQQWNLTVEHALTSTTALRASYIGTRGLQQVYRRNINVPRPSTTVFSASRRPYPQYSTIIMQDNGTGHLYQGLQWQVQHRSGKGLYLTSGWTWAKDVGENQGGVDSVLNPYDRAADRGDTFFTPRHHWVTTFNWELPIGRGKERGMQLPRGLYSLLANWQTAGIFQARTGHRLTPSYSGFDASGTGILGGRPDRFANGNLPTSQRSADRWFNPSAFGLPGASSTTPLTPPSGPIGRFGNSGVGIIEGPGLWQFDLSLVKSLPIRENLKLNFVVLATNLFNHPNLRDPSMDISSPANAGKIFGVYRDFNSSTIGPRVLNFGVRLEF